MHGFQNRRVLWSSDRPGQATIVAADGKLLLFNDRGEVLLVRADPHRYEELGRTEVFRGEICWTAPSLDHGRLYLRSPTRAACLYVGKPEQMEPPSTGLAMPTSAIPKGHRVELSWLMGAERECPFELPDAWELTAGTLWSLAAVAAAGLSGGGTSKARCGSAMAGRLGGLLGSSFWLGILVFGVAATPIGNRYSSEFVFTWPLWLFAVHQTRAGGGALVESTGRGRLGAWIGVAGHRLSHSRLLRLLRTDAIAQPCPRLVLPVTFLPAWPLAVPAARKLISGPAASWIDLLWMLAGILHLLLGFRRIDAVAYRDWPIGASRSAGVLCRSPTDAPQPASHDGPE